MNNPVKCTECLTWWRGEEHQCAEKPVEKPADKPADKTSKKQKSGKTDSKKKSDNNNIIAKQSLKDYTIQTLQVVVGGLFQTRGYWIFLLAVAGIRQYGDYASV